MNLPSLHDIGLPARWYAARWRPPPTAPATAERSGLPCRGQARIPTTRARSRSAAAWCISNRLRPADPGLTGLVTATRGNHRPEHRLRGVARASGPWSS